MSRFIQQSRFTLFPIRLGVAGVVCAVALLAWTPELLAAEVDPSRLPGSVDAQPDFVHDIRPIFEAACFECHGPERQRSGFRLDIREAALKGGDLGPAILPGQGTESPLLWYVAHAVDGMEMPPKGEGLSGREKALLRTWIDQGAIWPDGVDTAELSDPRDLWTFQPIRQPDVPTVLLEEWPRNDLDRFVLARLEQEGLSPSPEADRATLIRRLTFNLHGLPPTPQEVETFLADPSEDAYERLVERLLSSPRYGERWARHWLDVVHFGETHGYDKDKPRPHAWPYRDYVIRSFNVDKPYTRFVQEQVAGDILYPDDPDGVVALGFIAAGPWDFVGHVELPESKMDGLIARYNDRDDMVMTTLSTFMSLTVHCARCHDHKFDPISQQDYYALQAVFAGVDRADRPYDPDPEVHQKRRARVEEQRRLTGQRADLESIMDAVLPEEQAALRAQMTVKKDRLSALKSQGEASPSNGYHSRVEAMPDIEKWVQVDLGEVVSIEEIRLLPARPTDFPDTPGFGFPVRWRLEISEDPDFSSAHSVWGGDDTDQVNPGDHPVTLSVGAEPIRGRFVRMTATRLWKRTGDYVFALAELQVWHEGRNLALGAAVTALDSTDTGRWRKAFLVDGYDSRKRLADGESAEDAGHRRDQIASLEGEVLELERRLQRLRWTALSADEQAVWDSLEARLARISSELAALPSPQRVYAAATDFEPTGSFRPAGGVRPVHFLRRGDVRSPDGLAVPGSLNGLPELDGNLGLTLEDGDGERRAALARWLTDPKNGLLRRSIVNRVWHYHFGRGLVETPNDFGHMGGRPSHPELLDWLAVRFQEEGETLKSLHRLIVNSATYRQTTLPPGPDMPPAEQLRWRLAHARDADNRLLWRMNRQRLDAESLRDALLQVSGQLDETFGGPSVQQFLFKDDHSPVYDYAQFDPAEPGGRRRSIYRFIVRSVPDPFMETMDCPDPSILVDRRNTTLTALQALALLNNGFVVLQAEQLAERLLARHETVDAQVDALFREVFGRQPAAHESDRWQAYVDRHGLANACRILFNSNEFSFVD